MHDRSQLDFPALTNCISYARSIPISSPVVPLASFFQQSSRLLENLSVNSVSSGIDNIVAALNEFPSLIDLKIPEITVEYYNASPDDLSSLRRLYVVSTNDRTIFLSNIQWLTFQPREAVSTSWYY